MQMSCKLNKFLTIQLSDFFLFVCYLWWLDSIGLNFNALYNLMRNFYVLSQTKLV